MNKMNTKRPVLARIISNLLIAIVIVTTLGVGNSSYANQRVGIIDWSDLRVPSNLTGEQLELLLISDEMKGLGEAFAKAEKDHGVNAMFLIFLARLEGNNGKSGLSKDYNNMFGWTDSKDPRGFRYWNSKEQSINDVAKSIRKNYLSEDGKFYGGGFGVKDMNKKYCTSDEWAGKLISMSKKEAQRLSKAR